MKRPFTIFLLLCVAVGLAAGCRSTDGRAQPGPWQSLFDGSSTTGWRGYNRPDFPAQGWAVEAGCLRKIGGVHGGDIITVATFTNFELRWEWKIGPGGNNGVKYLVTEARPAAPGHEYQMLDDQMHPDSKNGTKRLTASFYDVLPPAEGKPLKPTGEWNHSRIVVLGDKVEHWLNGTKVLEYELGSPELMNAIAASKFKNAPGFGEKIAGHVMLTDHKDDTWFRNIKIRSLTRPAPSPR